MVVVKAPVCSAHHHRLHWHHQDWGVPVPVQWQRIGRWVVMPTLPSLPPLPPLMLLLLSVPVPVPVPVSVPVLPVLCTLTHILTRHHGA